MKYKYRNGEIPFSVTEVETPTGRHIVSISASGNTWWHDKDGKYANLSRTESDKDLIEVSPYDHIKKGDRVLAGPHKYRRIFSHVSKEGAACCFAQGRTEWSSCGETSRWSHVELWVES